MRLSKYQTEVQPWLKQFVLNSSSEEAPSATVASEVNETVKVLCWIMTTPQNHESKVRPECPVVAKDCFFFTFK